MFSFLFSLACYSRQLELLWGNVNKCIVGSKNTLNLKIIDQIYYFRYSLLQNFKGTRKNIN